MLTSIYSGRRDDIYNFINNIIVTSVLFVIIMKNPTLHQTFIWDYPFFEWVALYKQRVTQQQENIPTAYDCVTQNVITSRLLASLVHRPPPDIGLSIQRIEQTRYTFLETGYSRHRYIKPITFIESYIYSGGEVFFSCCVGQLCTTTVDQTDGLNPFYLLFVFLFLMLQKNHISFSLCVFILQGGTSPFSSFYT